MQVIMKNILPFSEHSEVSCIALIETKCLVQSCDCQLLNEIYSIKFCQYVLRFLFVAKIKQIKHNSHLYFNFNFFFGFEFIISNFFYLKFINTVTYWKGHVIVHKLCSVEILGLNLLLNYNNCIDECS